MTDPTDKLFEGWIELDPDRLPDPKSGPFLTTNNISSRNAYGMPSHIFIVIMFHDARGEPEGPITGFSTADHKIWGCTHYRPIFPQQLIGGEDQ